MNRYICIHAHCYQPPRENPWLEAVELQDSAYPHHDWNSRITAECYAPNTAARILGDDRRIIDIISTYARISFNFGPTLLSWMEAHEPATYRAILEAHHAGKERFGGHGCAIAQTYNHMIMPLANARDKKTQVHWGVRDFERRFGDRPEGIWLAETAVDLETLEFCAEAGIRFTILAPRQASRVRPIGGDDWEDVSGERIDPRRPYRCVLPSGRQIDLFFYDGHVAQDVAFGGVLDDGAHFAERLINAFGEENGRPQLVHIATDGETYGHHHRFGDMALAYCLYHIEDKQLAETTIYAEYLDHHPPEYEVEIFENSSWSCVHGVERWRAACGCNSGMHPGWQQDWRATLRGAMDWLRDSVSLLYEERAGSLLTDPWAARDDYIAVVLDRSDEAVAGFFTRHAGRELTQDERVTALKLLEMQRHAMLMYTSCGWFFDEISGIETVQVIQYAARTMQLARDVDGPDLEPAFIKILQRAPSNLPDLATGTGVYERYVRPAVVDLLRVGAHYAVSSLFEEAHADSDDIYCYRAKSVSFERIDFGRQRLAIGKVRLTSTITGEASPVHFAALHLGEQNLIGGASRALAGDSFQKARDEIKTAFHQSNIADIIMLIDRHLGTHSYSLGHLFKDEQRRVMTLIVDDMLSEVEHLYRQTYQRHYPLMQVSEELHIPLPRILSSTVSFVINADLRDAIALDPPKTDRVLELVLEARRWNIEIDEAMLGFEAGTRANRLMDRLEAEPENLEVLKALEHLLGILQELSLDVDRWQAQNRYFVIGKGVGETIRGRAESGDEQAVEWIRRFDRLGELLQVRIH